MINIGLAKLGKPIYFNDNSADIASWSDEIVKITHIFEKYGEKVHILSESDDKKRLDNLKEYDKIYVFCGVDSSGQLQGFRDRTKDLRLIVTDLRFFDNLDIYDKVYTQSPELGDFLIPTFIYYRWMRPLDLFPRPIKYYFGGGMRGRKEDFLEYVYRDECEHRSKITFGNGDIKDTRVGRDDHLALLRDSKYSIVIADVDYNKCGFITMRHFENIMNGVVSFVDAKYDPHETIIRKEDWRRVTGFEDLKEKMDWLSADMSRRLKAVEKQYKEIKKEYVSGKHVYDKLIQ